MIREENTHPQRDTGMVQPHLFDETLTSEDGAFCPECRNMVIPGALVTRGVHTCPLCRQRFRVRIEHQRFFSTTRYEPGCAGCGQ